MSWFTRAFGGGARASRDVDELLRSALLAVLDRDLDRAEELLRGAVRVDSRSAEPYLALGRLFRMRGEIGRAIRVHQNLLLRGDLTPDQKRAALLDLARDFRQGGFLRRAIAGYEEILAGDAKHTEALRALVGLLAEVREYDRAIEVQRRAARAEGLDGSSEEADLTVDMAEAAASEGRNEAARRIVKKALRRDKRSVRAWHLLGALEAERGRNKAALAAWSRIPKLDRRSGSLVYPQLEATYAALDRARDYEAFLRELLEEQPEDGDARLALARTLSGRGDSQTAVSELRALLAKDPDDLEARGQLGRLLLSEGRTADARSEYGALLDALERRGLLARLEKLE